eukprot:4153672-Prymnesium_polylepis.2
MTFSTQPPTLHTEAELGHGKPSGHPSLLDIHFGGQQHAQHQVVECIKELATDLFAGAVHLWKRNQHRGSAPRVVAECETLGIVARGTTPLTHASVSLSVLFMGVGGGGKPSRRPGGRRPGGRRPAPTPMKRNG